MTDQLFLDHAWLLPIVLLAGAFFMDMWINDGTGTASIISAIRGTPKSANVIKKPKNPLYDIKISEVLEEIDDLYISISESEHTDIAYIQSCNDRIAYKKELIEKLLLLEGYKHENNINGSGVS